MSKTEIKVSDNNIHIKDSYLYNKREIKSTVDDFINLSRNAPLFKTEVNTV